MKLTDENEQLMRDDVNRIYTYVLETTIILSLLRVWNVRGGRYSSFTDMQNDVNVSITISSDVVDKICYHQYKQTQK